MIVSDTQDILLNALNIRAGGGLQKVTSFLYSLSSDQHARERCLVIARTGGAISQMCHSNGLPHCSVDSSYANRIIYELGCRLRFPRGYFCFNLGGLPFLGASDHLVNLSECAFSNLFYPEIDFWGDFKGRIRVRKRLVDTYRRYSVAKSDYWIFQTPSIRKRAIDLCGFPEDRTCIIPPSASTLVSHERVDQSRVEQLNAVIPHTFRFLFLNGAQPNKRIHFLPLIAKAMLDMGCTNFCFVSTMPLDHPYTLHVTERFADLGVSQFFTNIGPVATADVASIVYACEAVCTFSRLESFSNNFVEAWKIGHPLVVTDADWARDSCGAGALYVDPTDASATADRLCGLIENKKLQDDLVRRGQRRLSQFPTVEEKTRLYLELIEVAKALGPCPKNLKRDIHWPQPQMTQ